MEMSNEEIVRRYRQAKNKRQQVNILAQLNCCSKDEIIKVLKQEGITDKQLPRAERSDKGKKKSGEPAAEAKETEITTPLEKQETNSQEEEKNKLNSRTVTIDVNMPIIENDELRKQLALIRLENSKLEQLVKKSETKNAILQKQIDDIKEDSDYSKSSGIIELKDIVKSHENEIKLLNEENENLRRQLDEITGYYNDSMKISAKLEENIKLLESDVETEGETIRMMHLENEELKIRLQQAESFILDKVVYS